MRIGFFEGIDSERGIAGRVADSLSLRQFLQVGLDEPTPDQVRISRTRRRITWGICGGDWFCRKGLGTGP